MIKTLIVLFVLFLALYIFVLLKTQKVKDFSELPYKKKTYLFDTNSEFYLYKILLELYSDKYFIFPQINYSHLIEPKEIDWVEKRKYRSKIDRKSADFVFCDKEQIIPKLVIELDGSVHKFSSKKSRDEFINEITGIVGLPILHIKTDNLDKEFIKKIIDEKLSL